MPRKVGPAAFACFCPWAVFFWWDKPVGGVCSRWLCYLVVKVTFPLVVLLFCFSKAFWEGRPLGTQLNNIDGMAWNHEVVLGVVVFFCLIMVASASAYLFELGGCWAFQEAGSRVHWQVASNVLRRFRSKQQKIVRAAETQDFHFNGALNQPQPRRKKNMFQSVARGERVCSSTTNQRAGFVSW